MAHESNIAQTVEVAATDARKQLSELISRVVYRNDRVILTRQGRPVAALISIGDFEDFEEYEDSEDAGGLKEALAEKGNVSLEEVKRELGHTVPGPQRQRGRR